ncbi:hypothetical protein ACOME3_009386 [Neoechinorhynchus agilis]
MHPTVIILKDGSNASDGDQHLVSNLNACLAVGEAVRTTLGPCGMDKLIVDSSRKVTVSNDGATVMSCLEVVHPAAKSLVEIARSQDDEVGDGTTSVVLLACEMINHLKKLVMDGVHPTAIIRATRRACAMAVEKINESAVSIRTNNNQVDIGLLKRCATTSLNSKLIAQHKGHFAHLVVKAVLMLDQESLPLQMIGIKKVAGGSVSDSCLIDGVAFKKAFSYAGFEMQPKTYKGAKIALLNIELELKAERDNAELRIRSVEDYQQVIDAEWTILYKKMEVLANAGVNVVLSRLPIGDVATQYFADRGIFCAGRIPDEDMTRTMKACGGCIVSTVDNISDSSYGRCGRFDEVQIGACRFNVFKDCPLGKSCTFIIRGGAQQYMDETERSLHDAIMVVRRTLKNDLIVAGGGACEMDVSGYLRIRSLTVSGKDQLVIRIIGRAFEVIPRQLCDNAGFDSINALTLLRQKHSERDFILNCRLLSKLNVTDDQMFTVVLYRGVDASQKTVATTEIKDLNKQFELRFSVHAIQPIGTDLLSLNFSSSTDKTRSLVRFENIELSPFVASHSESAKSLCLESKTNSAIKLEIKYEVDYKGKSYGVDVNKVDSIVDTFETGIWEPASVKINCIRAATEAVCLVLSVDQTIKAPPSAANR